MTQEDILPVVEAVLRDALGRGRRDRSPLPFRRLTYREAMERYGIDKPDLRFGFEIEDRHGQRRRRCRAVRARRRSPRVDASAASARRGPASASRKEIDALAATAKAAGAGGLLWARAPTPAGKGRA